MAQEGECVGDTEILERVRSKGKKMPAKRVVYTDHEGSCEVVFYSVEALEGMLKKSILNIIKDNELLKVMKKV